MVQYSAVVMVRCIPCPTLAYGTQEHEGLLKYSNKKNIINNNKYNYNSN